MKSALLLIRTPFQARLALAVLRVEDVTSYDLVYVTRHDSAEDRYYSDRLGHSAQRCVYEHLTPARIDSLQIHYRITSLKRRLQREYNLIILASIDEIVFAWAVRNIKSSAVVSIDDGTANYAMAGNYFRDNFSVRGKALRWLNGSASAPDIRKQIDRHYTPNPEFENIVEKARVKHIDVFGNAGRTRGEGKVSFFIGCPIEEALNGELLSRYRDAIANLSVDYYVRHPRENSAALLDAAILDKKGRIAEDAIIDIAQGRNIELFGWISSVMLNLRGPRFEKNVYLPKDFVSTSDYSRLAKSADCRVHLF